MPVHELESEAALPSAIGGVYRVERELARGGMARVYRVIDTRQGQVYALKLLVCSEERRATLRAMFEREYHTLVQLAHPRIVRVCDFGVDPLGPYYVMELLEGTDAQHLLRERQPPLEQVCVWLRDCASALTLVHSRRMVHRDVSPRNLWCTPDGRAKLIDFGTLVAMGPQSRIAGTPPFVPPEALNGQVLDGRCDLYALGALAYSLLTGRAAFPARTLGELPALWQRRPQRPDALRSDVPKPLADLVLELLSFDPRGRPASASEVYERLTQIAALPAENEQAVARAFLSSPLLSGRDEALAQLRKRLQRLTDKRGGTVALVAASGLGRSRLLANTVLEAKLAGGIAFMASATAVTPGPLAVATALAERLLEAQPSAASALPEQLGLLGSLSPRLQQLLGHPAPVELKSHDRLRKQSAVLIALFRAASQDTPLLVGVDDVQRADAASLGVLGKLSLIAQEQRSMLLVVTCDAAVLGDIPPALEQLVHTRHAIRLSPLAPEHTRELMAGLFGEVDGLDEAARWLHEVSQGSPASCMQYAQYLVDQGLARYDAGRWHLPEQLRGQGLPDSLGGMFERRVRALSADARALALGLALARDESRAVWQPESHLSIEDFPRLLGTEDSGRSFAALDELLRAGVLEQRDEYYVVAQRALVDALERLAEPELRRQLHVRVAEILAPKGGHKRFLAIRQLLLASKDDHARELFLDTVRTLGSGAADFGAMRVSLSAECGRAVYANWRARGGTPIDGIVIRRMLLLVCSVYDWSLAAFGQEQLAQLRRDCGLHFWDQTDATQPDLQRVIECLKRAGELYAATPEAERGLSALDALRELASAALVLGGAAVNSHDTQLARAIPELFRPVRSLSPLLDLLGELCELMRERACGNELGDRNFSVGTERLNLATELPEVLRMGAAGVHLHVQSVEDARRGMTRGNERLELLIPYVGEDMFLVVHGRWLGAAFRGNAALARRLFRQVQMITEDDVWRRKAYYFVELELHALTGDQVQLRNTCDAVAVLVAKFPGWRPWLAYGEAALLRLRGDFAGARAALQHGLQLAAAGEHRAWTRLAPAYAESLLLCGSAREADALAAALIADAQRLGLDRWTEVAGERVRALALAELREHVAARAALTRAFAVAGELQLAGLPLALLHEADARVALAAGEREACRAALEQLWSAIEQADAPALIHAYEVLRAQGGQQQSLPAAPQHPGTARTTFYDSTSLGDIHTRLSQVLTSQERAHQVLSLLIEDCGAQAGHLLLLNEQGLFGAAAVNDAQADGALLQSAQDFVDAHFEIKTQTVTASEVEAPRLVVNSVSLAPVMLVDREATPARLVGLALLRQPEAPLRAPSGELVRIVSHCLQEGGDTVALTLDD